jgi:DNA polymerase I-like protein with 3'-5' exonuclease and polymerase domains
MKNNLQVVHQSSLLDYFKPDVELDDNIVIIGAREHNTSLFEPFIVEFSNCKIFALDTETFGSQGVEALYFYYNKVRLLQIGLESGKVLIIDFGGWIEESRWEEIKADDKVQLAMSLLSEKCFANDVAVLGVNLGGFDFPVIRHHFGIIARQARDIMILSQVVRAGIGSYKHGMTALCALSHGLKGVAEWLGYEVDKTEQTSAWGWNLSNSQLNYSAVDVRILFPIFSDLRNLINELGLQYSARAESRAVGVFANMQFLGFPVRISEAERIRDEEIPLREQYLEEFNSYFPGVQYSSQQQTLAALRTIFPALEDIQKATLKKLDHPAASALYKLKESDKLIDDCKNLIERSFNGSIHSLFNQIGPAATGRSTSKSQIGSKSKAIYIGINLQNASKKVRSIFGFDDNSEMCLGIYDGSGMHQRIATELSQDPNLIAGYLEGLDMHSKLAAEIAKVLGEDSSVWTYEYILANKDSGKAKKYRDLAKKAFYSCLNGSGVGKILIGLHDLGFVLATREHAQEIYNAYYALYENLVNFIKTKQKETSKEAFRFDFQDKRFRAMNMHLRDYGRLQALTGRIQYIEMEENKWGGKQVNYTKTCASNWLLVEGDLLKMWMAEVQDKFWETPEWNANIINMVHDEINLVCSEQYKQEVANFVVQKMEEVFSAFITIIPALEPKMINSPTCGMCKNWSEK